MKVYCTHFWLPVAGAGLCLAALLFVEEPLCIAEEPKPVPLSELPPFEFVEKASGLPRHSGNYPALSVAWRPDRRVKGARRVFPHPVLPRRAVLTTDQGLLTSGDGGRTWVPLPEATAAKLGSVRGVGFVPHQLDSFHLATESKGVWTTDDAGKTFRQSGSTSNGLASNSVVAVHFYPFDWSFKTLLAIHGESAPGISRTEDGGKSWQIVADRYFVNHLLLDYVGGRKIFYLSGATRESPDRRSIYSSRAIGDHWYEVIRDVIPTDGATRLLAHSAALWSTADSGLFSITHYGAKHDRIGPETPEKWSSIGATWGPHADTELIYAYEPSKLGMVFSSDGLKSHSSQSRGIYTGPYIKEGSHIRANANGTIFYAVINNTFYVGHTRGGAFKISSVTLDPPVISYAHQTYRNARSAFRNGLKSLPKDGNAAALAKQCLGFLDTERESFPQEPVAITARIVGRGGAKPAKVTVDLSRLAWSPRTSMFDDGKHRDGEAGDGVYGATFLLKPSSVEGKNGEWRPRGSGRYGLTVTAVSEEGRLSGAVGILQLHARAESFTYWDEDIYGPRCYGVEGDLYWEHQWSNAKRGRVSLRLAVQGGPWSAPYRSNWYGRSVNGFYALSFWVKTDGTRDEELSVQFRDGSESAYPTTTPPVPVLKEGLVEGGTIDREYRRVVVPVHRVIKDTPKFRPDRLCYVIFSGPGGSPRNYWIDLIRFHLDKEDLDSGL